jgi:hypothetical protein
MAICFGLAAWSWCTGGASAQAPSGNPWDAIEWVERRYKIEAMRFKARDETGVDWWGRDEVMVGTFDAKGSTVSDEIGDIDSGDTHKFDPAKSCIIAVRPGEAVLGKTSVCDDVGEPAPLSFRVEFWEKDFQGFFGGFCGPVSDDHHFPRHCLHYGFDDFIGQAQLVFLAHDFEAVLPNVGDEYIETVVLGGCPPGVGVCTSGWGPWDVGDYSFTYRTTRLPDVKVGLHGVLDEAMRKIGARSELEAIVAGLRSLRAPSPRQIKPEQ